MNNQLRLDIHQSGLSQHNDLAKSQGIEIYLHSTFVELIRGTQSVRMSKHHSVYIRGMLLRFDYYFSAVEPYFEGNLAIADYASPRYHHLVGFDDFPAYFNSYPEPMASSDAYLSFANLKPGNVVLDLGAYAGMASILFSKEVGAKGVVVSYEPDFQNYNAACQNIRMHEKISGLTNIHLSNQAVWKDCNGIEFSCDGNMGSSATQIVGKRGQVRRVETITLEKVLIEMKLDKVDFIKMDIEGAEIEVIKSSLEVLKKTRPLLVMESHRVENVHSAGECARLLRGIGYKISTSDSKEKFSDFLLYAR